MGSLEEIGADNEKAAIFELVYETIFSNDELTNDELEEITEFMEIHPLQDDIFKNDPDIIRSYMAFLRLSPEGQKSALIQVINKRKRIDITTKLMEITNELYEKELITYDEFAQEHEHIANLFQSHEFIKHLELSNLVIFKKYDYAVHKSVCQGYGLYKDSKSDLDSYIDYCETIYRNISRKVKVKPIEYTYLMTDHSGYIKIGKSKNTIQRFKSLRIGNPTIEIIAILDKNVELLLHGRFLPERFMGEWYKLSTEDIRWILSNYPFEIEKKYKNKFGIMK